MSNYDPEYRPKHSAVRTAPVTVLFVEANIDTAGLIEKALLSAGDGAVRIEWVTTLARALERLANGDIEVVLSGVNLPDCAGPGIFEQLRQAAPDALVLPLREMGGQSVRTPDDDLTPEGNSIDVSWLPDVLHYVIRRKSTEAAWRAADEALFEEKERARVTLGSIGDAVLVTDIEGNVTYLNQVAESLTGWRASEALGKPLPTVFNIADRETGKRARNPALHAMTENTTVGLAANCVLNRLDGTATGIEDSAAPVHDRHGEVTGAVIVFRDVNHSRTMTRKMAWLARHDSLTGLPSRALFEERFRQVISLAHRHKKRAAMLFVDLNNFKRINDEFGHTVGDRVLKAVAGHLRRGVRDTDTVCRHGGDEFVILLTDATDSPAAEQAADKLLTRFAEPLLVDGHPVNISMSIGISMYPDQGRNIKSLIEHADLAMYEAKKTGRNTCGFPTTAGKGKAADSALG